MPSSHLILSSLLLLPPIPPSIRVFSNESTLHMRCPKYWSFSFSISPSNEHLGLISFRMDWLDLLAVQGTLKSLFHHYSTEWTVWISCTHRHHQMLNTEIRLIIFFVAKDGEALYSQQKHTDCCSDHELIAKFRLKLKKVGETTRPFK